MKTTLIVKRKLLGLIAVCLLFNVLGCATAPPTKPGHRPVLSSGQKSGYLEYLDKKAYPNFKAFAIAINSGFWWGRSWGYNKPEDAIKRSLQECGKGGGDCQLYAVGKYVVAGLSEEQFSKVLQKYYEETAQIADPKTIKQLALNGDEIERLISGRKGEGVRTIPESKFTIEFWTSGRLMIGFFEGKTRTPHISEGKWWIEANRLCIQFGKELGGLTNCGYVVQDDGGIAFYDENYALAIRGKVTGFTNEK